MREIKFRALAQDTDIGLFECYAIDFERRIALHANGEWYDYIELNQYTGLKDKNGIEIYEKDNIKKPDFKTEKGKIIRPKAYEVIFESGGFHAKDGFHLSLCVKEYEVVGNTYEDPNLIQQLGRMKR